ncbi:hypothetical protein HN803_02385 [candidate division WWE3 bacterium]|jgi:hypothetical protein|nr:hypothetical protein [candidate division WWE3 bacterium]
MQITPKEKSLLRSRPQRTKLGLSIFRPTTALKCRVDDVSISRNALTITYDTVTEGVWTSVETGMVVLVGTSEGGRELGTVRLRSITSSEIVVAENSYIEWKDNLYLTIQRFWEVLPVFPRIISDPADAESTIWYKDYDIPYTNQNTVLGALPCAGPHRAAYLDSGSVDVYYTATGTTQVAGASYDTHWWFDGGGVTGSTAFTPGNIAYDTAGHYTTRLTVTGTNYVDTTYRYVSIYDRPGEGDDTPILKWELSKIDGGRAGGGYTTSIRIFENINVNEGDVVVLFGESWIGDTKQTIGGNASGNSDIFFVGHILSGSIQYNYKHGEVSFGIGSIAEYLKEQEGFSISVESVPSPSDWYQLYDLNITKAMYHYLKWHTTVLSSNDIQVLGDDRPLQYFDSDRNSIYDALNSFIRGAVVGSVVSDMQGKIWIEHDAQAFPNASDATYSSPIMELKKSDWVGSPRIVEQLIPPVSYLERGGIAYSGVSTGTFAPLMSNAPGSAPMYKGKVDRSQGLALKSQVEINEITGNILANKNHTHPTINHKLVGNFRNLDIAPQEKVSMVVETSDNPTGKYISGSYMPTNIGWTYDSQKQLFHPDNVTFSSLVTGSAGETIVIPELPDDGGYHSPRISIPSIPSLSFPAMFSNIATDSYLATVRQTSGVNYDPVTYVGVTGTSGALTTLTTPTEITMTQSGTYLIVMTTLFRKYVVSPVYTGAALRFIIPDTRHYWLAPTQTEERSTETAVISLPVGYKVYWDIIGTMNMYLDYGEVSFTRLHP